MSQAVTRRLDELLTTERFLRDNRDQRRQAERDLLILNEELACLLANGRDEDGLEVTTMARLAGVSRNKAHRLLREVQRGSQTVPEP